jgi:hypothetical protein
MTVRTPTAPGGGCGPAQTGSGPVLGLRIPADEGRPVALAVLRLTVSELSDAIGGGLLEDALFGDVDGAGCAFLLDEHRTAKGLPRNDRAAVLTVGPVAGGGR